MFPLSKSLTLDKIKVISDISPFFPSTNKSKSRHILGCSVFGPRVVFFSLAFFIVFCCVVEEIISLIMGLILHRLSFPLPWYTSPSLKIFYLDSTNPVFWFALAALSTYSSATMLAFRFIEFLTSVSSPFGCCSISSFPQIFWVRSKLSHVWSDFV